MKKNIWLFKPIVILLMALCLLLTVPVYFYNPILFYGELAVILLVVAVVLIKFRTIQRDIHSFLQGLGRMLTTTQQESLTQFPVPVAVVDKNHEILWYNELFKENVLEREDLFGCPIRQLLPQFSMENALRPGGITGEYRNRFFQVYAAASREHEEEMYVLYFLDQTDSHRAVIEYQETRPSVVILLIDNYDEVMRGVKESEKAQVLGAIETILERFVTENKCLLRKMDSRDKFLAVIEERYMRQLTENRFKILDEMRSIATGDRTPITFSIGVGRGAPDLVESERMASQALEMALGRGGDQAAIKTAAGFEFYGGLSKGIEKRTKVKTRVIAAALSDLIENADNVLIMGHRGADLDCLGSAVGLVKAVRSLHKSAYVALQKNRNLAAPLYNRLAHNGMEDYFLEPETAMGLVTRRTLLIVVDTHNPTFLESPELYAACKHVVVIDHHRKMVGHIDNAMIFFHEPYASSASEMVTELVQYLGEGCRPGRFEAEGLLAGIMLDTKDFVLRTGVRTFEAAAYLRRMGADTVEVKKLFYNSLESYQQKARLIASAIIYRRCAIAAETEPGLSPTDLRIVASQAADELLNIVSVDASFVLYPDGSGVAFSARSMGAVNVQLVMERLGGGGHLTMAGAQLQNVSMEEAKNRLYEALDWYEQNQRNS